MPVGCRWHWPKHSLASPRKGLHLTAPDNGGGTSLPAWAWLGVPLNGFVWLPQPPVQLSCPRLSQHDVRSQQSPLRRVLSVTISPCTEHTMARRLYTSNCTPLAFRCTRARFYENYYSSINLKKKSERRVHNLTSPIDRSSQSVSGLLS